MDSLAEVYQHSRYVIRRKVFKFLGGAFHIYDEAGRLVGYSRQKAFKLREDIRVYTDQSRSQELLAIMARQVIDFAASYDVVDSLSGEAVGTLRRKGFKSIFRDEWLLLDTAGVQIGVIREDSTGLALLRRFIDLARLIAPQKFHAYADQTEIANYQQNYNPFVHKLSVELLPTVEGKIDRRLLLAAGVLLTAIEGRQK